VQFYVKAVFAGLTVLISSTTAVLVQIGEGAAFSDVEIVGWLIIFGATLAAVGGVLGLQAAPASVSTSVR